METSTRRPLLLGVAASVAAAPTCFFVYSAAFALGQSPVNLTDLAFAGLFIYFYGTFISGPIALAVGLPFTLWLRRRGQLTWSAVCLGAMLTGLLAFIALQFLAFPGYSSLQWFAFVGMLSGLASGVVFCAVVRPNNSFKPTSPRDAA